MFRPRLLLLTAVASLFSAFSITSIAIAEDANKVSTADETGFVSLFDGRSLDGWKKSTENPDSWKVVDGMLVCEGERCHLFYTGELAPLKNFHFKADVKLMPGSNAGIYFHTKYQATDWPKHGYECQVNVSHKDPKKTSSLYGVENVDAETLAANGIRDNEWYTQEIIVRGKHIELKVNGKTLVDYTEPSDKEAFSDRFERRLGEGTFALQAHDPQSKAYFKNLRVKPLDE
jgi:hypothetical protein